jgi:hypothetical protein
MSDTPGSTAVASATPVGIDPRTALEKTTPLRRLPADLASSREQDPSPISIEAMMADWLDLHALMKRYFITVHRTSHSVGSH